MRLSRRLIIAGAAAAPFVLRHRAHGAADPFTLGVASGEPSPDGFVIWTRLAPDPLSPDGLGGMRDSADARFEVAEDQAMGRIVRRGQVRTDPQRAHTLNIVVSGLQPDRPYWYRFFAKGAASPIGKARTAPQPGAPVGRLRMAIASCAHWESGHFSAYRHMAAETPDLILFLGDYIYEYSYGPRRNVVRRHDIQDELRTLPQFRNRYALHRTDPDLQTLHAAAPCLATWDDHELQNDYGGVWSQNPTIPEDAFLRRRTVAYQAFLEHMPLRPRTPATRLYARHRWGALAEISVLDARQYRSRHACERPNTRRAYVAPLTCADLDDPARSMLGFEQEDWLYKGFAASRTQWNIVAQQLLIAPYLQAASGGAIGAFTEGWSGFTANRGRMLGAVADSRLSNPVFFGGDMHAFVTARLSPDAKDPTASPVATEFVGTSITSDGAPESLKQTLKLNPHIEFFDNQQRGYLSVDLTPGRMETRLQAISDRQDRNASVATLRRYVVETGRPGAVEA